MATESNTGTDPVLALCFNYFYPARALHIALHEARACYEALTNEDEKASVWNCQVGPYLALWQAALFPLCDGFRKLGLKDPALDDLIREAMGALRSAAKAVSSYADNTSFKQGTGKLIGRHGLVPNLNTAEDLQRAFEDYFKAHLFAVGRNADDQDVPN